MSLTKNAENRASATSKYLGGPHLMSTERTGARVYGTLTICACGVTIPNNYIWFDTYHLVGTSVFPTIGRLNQACPTGGLSNGVDG
jgi:hypothetical protein